MVPVGRDWPLNKGSPDQLATADSYSRHPSSASTSGMAHVYRATRNAVNVSSNSARNIDGGIVNTINKVVLISSTVTGTAPAGSALIGTGQTDSDTPLEAQNRSETNRAGQRPALFPKILGCGGRMPSIPTGLYIVAA